MVKIREIGLSILVLLTLNPFGSLIGIITFVSLSFIVIVLSQRKRKL
ncbi:MAG TPA: hypothetical protein VMZ29_01155 [Candidatus Bathyarchaeia archaeon]|nr:hypothetical protein [Candidatus Bathyarchaeia archaeon]